MNLNQYITATYTQQMTERFGAETFLENNQTDPVSAPTSATLVDEYNKNSSGSSSSSSASSHVDDLMPNTNNTSHNLNEDEPSQQLQQRNFGLNALKLKEAEKRGQVEEAVQRPVDAEDGAFDKIDDLADELSQQDTGEQKCDSFKDITRLATASDFVSN
jgi:hypothetical protein